MSERIPKINALIQHELSELLSREIEFPGNCLVTIVGVETSKDLRHAKVWVSILPEFYIGKAFEQLKREAGHLQFLLNKRLSMKPLPRLSFAIDDTEQKASDIESLLDQIAKTK